uniref:Uncharacterized protein n=1 Tax=Amphimedon queenslandica TaxID=400682 RepID=A0A1X7TVR4_AMPQE
PSPVARYPSPVAPYPSPVAPYPSPVAAYPSSVAPYPSSVAAYPSPVAPYPSSVVPPDAPCLFPAMLPVSRFPLTVTEDNTVLFHALFLLLSFPCLVTFSPSLQGST